MADIANEEYTRLLREEEVRTEVLEDARDSMYRVPTSTSGICSNMTALALGIFFATVLLFLALFFVVGPMIQKSGQKPPGQCVQCPPGKPGPSGEQGVPGGPGGKLCLFNFFFPLNCCFFRKGRQGRRW